LSEQKRVSSYHPEEQTLAQLPTPSADELIHSKRLVDFLVAEIEASAGIISFRNFMDRVLYQPGLGYYSAGLSKFGAEGDFVTAPEISPLYGQTLARQCESIFNQDCARNILEFGAGSGRLCEQLLSSFSEACDYSILELSADLRFRQQDYLRSSLAVEVFERIVWLDELPSGFNGIVLGNEVLDAMPVNLMTKDRDWYEIGVKFDGSRFNWCRFTDDSKAVAAMRQIESIHGMLPSGYTTEVNMNYRPWLNALGDCCNQVVVLMIDYGYEQAQYYHPERNIGTLICHYHHRVHGDALLYPGLQDITASVDFDAFADAAIDCEFELCGLSTQRQFLLSNGLLGVAEGAEQNNDTMGRIGLAQQIKTLTLPDEMGERFKVIGLQKNIDVDIVGFAARA
jgi:SAM-dependent MidA family methyltransferase